MALVLGFVAATFGYVVIAGVVAAFGASFEDPPPGVTIGATIVQDLALIIAAIGFAAMAARPRPWQFGLAPTRWWPAVGWTLLRSSRSSPSAPCGLRSSISVMNGTRSPPSSASTSPRLR